MILALFVGVMFVTVLLIARPLLRPLPAHATADATAVLPTREMAPTVDGADVAEILAEVEAEILAEVEAEILAEVEAEILAEVEAETLAEVAMRAPAQPDAAQPAASGRARPAAPHSGASCRYCGSQLLSLRQPYCHGCGMDLERVVDL